MTNPLDLTDEQIAAMRLDCLKIVAERENEGAAYHNPKAVVHAARLFADFVLGTNDAEVIGAVRELAKKVA